MRVENPSTVSPPPELSPDDARQVRDDGLSLVARTNRWLIGGALTLAAALTGLTAHSFHATTASAHPSTGSAAAQPSAPSAPSGDDSAPLQSPSSAPAPAPAPVQQAPAPVVSGGS
ncbi:MAG TPA: hypothetical protein VFN87_01090 [Solirubrobacteraceae bacterium]|nr:hypothetical protein [Solirubrobacteraceae bacterium]